MPKRLLIIDDEETLTFSLYQSFILSKEDYEVVTANSGEEALKKAKSVFFDLVITDICMPGIDGFEVITQFKKNSPETKLIVMTAYGSYENKEKAIHTGALHYIEKPFEVSDLRKIVLEMLN